jgi:hypothetical protein
MCGEGGIPFYIAVKGGFSDEVMFVSVSNGLSRERLKMRVVKGSIDDSDFFVSATTKLGCTQRLSDVLHGMY